MVAASSRVGLEAVVLGEVCNEPPSANAWPNGAILLRLRRRCDRAGGGGLSEGHASRKDG